MNVFAVYTHIATILSFCEDFNYNYDYYCIVAGYLLMRVQYGHLLFQCWSL